MKLERRPTTPCIKAIISFMIILLPWCVFAQNDASRISGGNAPMKMVLVPSGLCMTDSAQSTFKNFYISNQPVTWRLWNEIMGTRSGGEASDSLPASNVSREEVQLFILWFNQKSGMQFRLPTTMEWGCAVRNGFLPNDSPMLCSDGGDVSAGFCLAMDDPREVRATEVVKKVEQERNVAEKPAADSTRKVEQESLFLQKSLTQQLRAERQQIRQNRLNALPPSVFFTLNAAYTSMPQWSVGFKIGTMRVVGWYFSAMTTFHFRGAFSPFQPNQCYYIPGTSRTAYLEGQLGLVVRPLQVLSIHVGAGFGYRSLTFSSDHGWHSFPTRSYYGPTASFGFMFHIKSIVVSAEATGMVYNLNELNDMRYALGARAGVGFCLPYKKEKRKQPTINN